ncbi:MAG: GspE/PulE family protein, partial [Maioricimonas sp. JB049]
MSEPFSQSLRAALDRLPSDSTQFVPHVVDHLLQAARDAAASDIHLIPLENGSDLQILWRVDGVLHEVARIPGVAANVIARLKVLAGLLTYKTDVPQEGRLQWSDRNVELRLSTFPILSGEKGVVRLFVGSGQYRQLDDLSLPPDVVTELKRLLTATSGMLLVSGPAGSGKTTTLYACLRETLSSPIVRSVCSLEDPVEAVIPGVSQSQVRPGQGFDYAVGLRSLVRQDPEVIMVGEIRDRETAATALQGSEEHT